MGFSLGDGGGDGEDGNQVGNLGGVDFHPVQRGAAAMDDFLGYLYISAHPAEDRKHGAVPLVGIELQPSDLDFAPQCTRGQKKRRLGPIPFHRRLERAVPLPARDPPAVGKRLDFDAGQGEGLQGHMHIIRRFQRRGQAQVTVLLTQGKGQQQAADKLAGHVPGQR